MSSALGFVDKDNDYSNVAIKQILSATDASFQTLNVANLNVLNTIVTNSQSASSVGALSVGVLKVTSTLEILSPSNQIVFENARTGASITLNCQPTSVPGITYNIPDVGVNFSNFVMTDGNQTINGTKTFTTMPIFPSGGGGTVFPLIFVTNAMNQITFGSGNVIIMNVPAPAASRTYTLPDTGANSQFVMTDGTQTINGVRTYTSGIVVNATTNQLVLSSPNTVTITAPSPATSRIYTIPDSGANSQFVMTDGTQTINGIKTFTSVPVFPSLSLPSITLTNTSNQIGLTTGSAGNPVITVTAPAAAAARTYTLPDAGGAANFVLTAGAQTIAGTTTFSSAVPITATTNQLALSTVGAGIITLSTASAAANRTYTLPDAGGAATFVLSTGTLAITQASLTLTNTTNQLTLGTTNTTTISSTAPSASRTYTIPDGGGAANVILSTAVAGTTTNSIQFGNATVSYVPTSLNYYEQITPTVNYTSTAFTVTQTPATTVTRIGSIVIMAQFFFTTSGNGASPGMITSQAGVIPSRFRPSQSATQYTTQQLINALSNSINAVSVLLIDNNGTITVTYGLNNGTFANSGSVGLEAFTMCWIVA